MTSFEIQGRHKKRKKNIAENFPFFGRGWGDTLEDGEARRMQSVAT